MKFRYETTTFDFLDGIAPPSFSMPSGMRFHSYAGNNPAYIVNNRNHGTTDLSLSSEGMKKTYRDLVYDFWYTTLSEGEYDFTVIDHRNRILFNTSWNLFDENISKSRGGIININYGLSSPVVWTPPTFGIFPMVQNNLTNHNLSGDDLSLVDGAFENTGTLRNNGYALKLAGNTSSQLTGANQTSALSWSRSSEQNSLTLFGQVNIGDVLNNNLSIIEVTNGNGEIFKLAAHGFFSDKNLLWGYIDNGATYSIIRKSESEYYTIDVDTWYDIALSYNAQTGKTKLYYQEASSTSFSNFLSGETSIDTGIGEYNSSSIGVPDAIWTECKLLKEEAVDTLSDSETAQLQNVFILDGAISQLEFNTLRRLCYEWNRLTTVEPK